MPDALEVLAGRAQSFVKIRHGSSAAGMIAVDAVLNPELAGSWAVVNRAQLLCKEQDVMPRDNLSVLVLGGWQVGIPSLHQLR